MTDFGPPENIDPVFPSRRPATRSPLLARGSEIPAISLAAVRALPPSRVVEILRLAVALHHRYGYGPEADAVWEACIAGYRASNRPYGRSDAGFGTWILEQEPGTFAAAGVARLVDDYLAR